jgi:GNAT superfamily N-acetyltransferase
MKIPDGYTDLPAGKIASVVTYLEMRRSPEITAESESYGWVLKPHPTPDVDWYRRLFRTVGQDWLWFSRLQMTDEELRAIIHDSRIDVFALEFEGREVGILELDRREMPDIELAFIGLTHGLIGRGAGRFLMDRALQIAWSHQPARVLVHTCTLDHPRALDFYRKAGFVPYKRAIEVADDPRMDGTLPGTAAPSVPIL